MSEAEKQTIGALAKAHPMPWAPRVMGGTNIIVMFDAAGVEVPLFTMLGLVQMVTASYAKTTQATPA